MKAKAEVRAPTRKEPNVQILFTRLENEEISFGCIFLEMEMVGETNQSLTRRVIPRSLNKFQVSLAALMY